MTNPTCGNWRNLSGIGNATMDTKSDGFMKWAIVILAAVFGFIWLVVMAISVKNDVINDLYRENLELRKANESTARLVGSKKREIEQLEKELQQAKEIIQFNQEARRNRVL